VFLSRVHGTQAVCNSVVDQSVDPSVGQFDSRTIRDSSIRTYIHENIQSIVNPQPPDYWMQ